MENTTKKEADIKSTEQEGIREHLSFLFSLGLRRRHEKSTDTLFQYQKSKNNGRLVSLLNTMLYLWNYFIAIACQLPTDGNENKYCFPVLNLWLEQIAYSLL